MTSNTYIDKLDDIVNKYNNTSHRTIKEKPANIKLPSMYFDLSKQNNKDIPKFKVIVHVRISTYTIVFTKGDLPYGSEKVFSIKKHCAVDICY